MYCILEGVKDKPRISNQCCSALMKLATSLEPTANETSNALTRYLPDALKILDENTHRDDYQGTGIDLT
jgi:hypothetical protein